MILHAILWLYEDLKVKSFRVVCMDVKLHRKLIFIWTRHEISERQPRIHKIRLENGTNVSPEWTKVHTEIKYKCGISYLATQYALVNSFDHVLRLSRQMERENGCVNDRGCHGDRDYGSLSLSLALSLSLSPSLALALSPSLSPSLSLSLSHSLSLSLPPSITHSLHCIWLIDVRSKWSLSSVAQDASPFTQATDDLDVFLVGVCVFVYLCVCVCVCASFSFSSSSHLLSSTADHANVLIVLIRLFFGT